MRTRSTKTIAGILMLAGCMPTPEQSRKDISKQLQASIGASIRSAENSKQKRWELPKGVQLDDGLTEAEAIALAVWNNAALQSTLAQLGFAKADLYQAGTIPNPSLILFLPIGPKQLEMTLGWALDWLWTRPYRVAAAQLDLRATAKMLATSGLDSARDARLAHLQLRLARGRLALLSQAAKTWGRMAKLAQARFDAGAASRLALTAAQSDARIAQLAAKQQKRTVRVAQARLREQLNLPEGMADLSSIALHPQPLPPELPALPRLLTRAERARPEVRAAELRIEAIGKRAGLERARIFDLIAFADSNGPGFRAFEAGPGFQLTLPIFHQNQAGRARVQAELESATWGYLAVKQTIGREVQTAYHQLRGAHDVLVAWPKEVVEPLRENVGRAERAYKAGGATYLEVLDATRRLIEAQLRGLELELEARNAFVRLLRHVGGKL